jgi:cytochrome d ubiquinol oxidase subunit I
MDVLILSRIQFAFHTFFHYLFPPMSIGIGALLVIMEGLYLKTKEEKYKQITTFWIKIFALTFALGVATGLVQTFAFGTNWSRYSRFVGDVFGSALAAEGIFAFFLEAGFLGVLLFGWDRVGPKLHYFSTICVSLGAHFSAVWIVVANSWMQTPAGYRIEETAVGPRAVITEFWAMVFNPSSVDRLFHVLLGCWLTGAFFLLSIAAYYFLKKRHLEEARVMMKIGLLFSSVCLLLQLASGDSSARIVAKYQPAKLAAMEGIYETRPSTPLTAIGWVDTQNEKVVGLQIPSGLSLLTNRSLTEPVLGLDQIPKEDWPNVQFVFQTYHLMILMWGLMFLLTLLGLWRYWKGTVGSSPFLLRSLVVSVAFPHIAQQAGWFTAELGRQPWIVYHLLRTRDGVSTSIDAGQVVASLVMFVCIYALLFALFVFLIDRKVKQGLEQGQADSVYRNPLESR